MPVPQATLDVAFFGGTFVGGSATRRLPDAGWVGIAGLIYGGLMLYFRGPLTGHVGVMGAAGTVACLITAAVEWLVLKPRVNRSAWRVASRTRPGSS